MPSIHVSAVREVVDRRLEESPEWRDIVHRVLGRIRANAYPEIFLDMIVQKDRPGYDVYDAYCIAQFDLLMQAGKLAFIRLPMGRSPFVDRMVAQNNAAFASLPPPFRGGFAGGCEDQDGEVSWDRPVEANIVMDEELKPVTIPKRSAPLEVGTTKASRSLLHLKATGCLARWPYHHDVCDIFFDLTHWSFGGEHPYSSAIPYESPVDLPVATPNRPRFSPWVQAIYEQVLEDRKRAKAARSALAAAKAPPPSP